MQALNKGPGWLRASRQSFREGAMQKKAPETTQPVPVEVDFGAYRVGDPEEFGRNMLKLMEEGSKLLSDYLQLAGATAQRTGGAEALPVAAPEAGDNRFNDPEWSRNPYFDFWKQAYLISTRWVDLVLDETEGLDERTRQRAEFYLKQMASALSPTNFPVTNPVVLRETLASNGRNLLHGMANFMHD